MKLINYLLVALLTLTLGACNTNENNQKIAYVDIMTLEATGESGSVLTFRLQGNSPLITLTCSKPFSQELVGKRLVIIYTIVSDTQRGEDGVIDIEQSGATFGGGDAPKVSTAGATDNWQSDEIELVQAELSGEYLNLGLTLNTNTSPRVFELYVDETTMDSDYPELHLVYEPQANSGGTSYSFFGSYNIGGLMNRPTAKGVKLTYNGFKEGEGTIIYVEKPTNSFAPAN